MLFADDVEVVLADGRRLVGPASITIRPGTLTALVGPSGSGKTTLLRLLSGITLSTGGRVTLGGEPAAERVEDLGYVPQRETVHARLTVSEALRYAAILRLDAGEDIHARTTQVLAELDLRAQADTLVGDLSGGERRRVACGMELVGRPSVLLLDEPTSGLDAVLERRLMKMFRRLADGGRAVVVVTHATASLDLCDTVAVMERGRLTIAPGADAAAPPGPDAEDGAADADGREVTNSADPAGIGARTRPFGLEFRVLTGRYARTLLRDTRTLTVLLAQAPLIGLLIAVLFPPGSFDSPGDEAANAVQLVFLVMTGAIWLGITSSCREIVKERGIVEREFDVGLRPSAYVLAKAVVLFCLSALQAVVMTGVVEVFQPLGISAGHAAAFIGLTILTAWVSVCLGLLVSALARSVDQAAGVVPLILIPQLLFSGALVPLDRMPRVAAGFAQATFGRWAYAGMGSTVDLNERIFAKATTNQALGFSRAFFAFSAGQAVAALSCFAVVLIVAAATTLKWRAPTDDD